jgi:urease accessory protein
MNIRHLGRIVALSATSLLTAWPASAHHVMGGKTPSDLIEGLLSGLGHPVIGPEHLAFLLAVGVVVGSCGLSLALPAVFVTGTALGVTLHLTGIVVPGAEIAVALSVLLAGYLLARGRTLSTLAWSALFGAAGVLHGYAFGESIVGAESTPVGAYLAGLVIVQSVLSIGIALIVRHMRARMSEIAPRLAGAAILGVGFTALVAQLIPGA